MWATRPEMIGWDQRLEVVANGDAHWGRTMEGRLSSMRNVKGWRISIKFIIIYHMFSLNYLLKYLLFITHARAAAEDISLSMSSGRSGSWLRGTTIRKGTTTPATRSHTPQTQATSSTIVFSGGVKDASGRTSEYFVRLALSLPQLSIDRRHVIAVKSMDDQCPVCKSDRYLNPKLRLLVSSCYHKMCVA